MKKIKLIFEGKSVRQDMYINRVENKKTLLNFPLFYLANEEKLKKKKTIFMKEWKFQNNFCHILHYFYTYPV